VGKVTGFLEHERLEEPHEATEARKKHYREFYLRLADDADPGHDHPLFVTMMMQLEAQ